MVSAAPWAASYWHVHTLAASAGAGEIAQNSMYFAEQNMVLTFEFAQKVMRAKDPAEVMRLQSEYLAHQTKARSLLRPNRSGEILRCY